ncbi:MAG: hypothetical protein ACI4YA_06200 [Candidatus Spyradenecus sp.]
MSRLRTLCRLALLTLCLLPLGRAARAEEIDERLMKGIYPTMELIEEVFPPPQVARILFGWAADYRQAGEEVYAYACDSTATAFLTVNGSPSCQTLEALLRDHPQCDILRNNAAWTRLIATGDAAGALELLRGVRLNLVSIRDTRACIYLALDRPADALQDILAALEMAGEEENDPSNLILFDHAGDIFYRNGLYPAARKAWTHAQRLATRFRKADPAVDGLFLIYDYDDARVRRKLRALRRLHPTPSE